MSRCLACLLLVSAAGPAAAGPVAWSYTATVEGGPGTGVLALPLPAGSVVVPLPDGESGGFKGGAAEVRLAAIGGGAYQYEPGAPRPGPVGLAEADFRVRLVVTDQESKQSGELMFDGTVIFDHRADDPTLGELRLDAAADWQATLGRHRYAVTVRPGESDGVSWLVADVSITAAAPEPATLGLAAVGLGLLAVRRRK